MEGLWDRLAQRIAAGLAISPGALVELRDHAGNQKLLHAMLLTIEEIGATPLTHILPAAHLERLLAAVPAERLAGWDQHRAAWAAQAERVVVLAGASPRLADAPPAALAAFHAAEARVEAARNAPVLLAAIPSLPRAAQLGIAHEELERQMIPALLADPAELRAAIDRALDALADDREILLRSGQDHELRLHAATPWLGDDGRLDLQGLSRAAILPGGAVGAAVEPDSVEGSLALAVAGPARAVVLRFSAGRVVEIDAASGAGALEQILEADSALRQISRISLGLNQHLRRPLGWPLVDQRIAGCLSVAFGPQRPLALLAESAPLLECVLMGASLLVNGRMIVEEGRLKTSTA